MSAAALPETMAVVQTARFGGPGVLERVTAPVPAIAADEVLVRVAYCGVCRHDLLTRAGAFHRIDLPVIPGHQVGGRFVAVGA